MIEFRPKKRYSPAEVIAVVAALEKAVENRVLTKWDDGSGLLQAAYRGTGSAVHPKWNVKIYYATKKGAAIVCTDFYVIDQLVNHGALRISSKPVVSVDDAGWGFPLCGVMVGASDGKRCVFDVVPVDYFRNDTYNNFKSKAYLHEYARRGIALVRTKLNAAPETHRVEICTGYVNQVLKEKLRELDYEVSVVEITGLLQKELEVAYKSHVQKQLGLDLYYDPKAMDRKSVATAYYKAVKWGGENRPDLLKSGWKSIN